MKIASLLAVLSLGSLVAACNSLDSPFSGLSSNPLLNTGRDARVYNGNTGHYEWPNTTPTPKPQPTPTVIASAKKATPTPAATPGKKGGAFVQGSTPAATPGKPKATPKAVAVKATPAPATPEATPSVVAAQITPIPAPEKGTGIYNIQTHRFEWAPSGAPTPGKPAGTPAKKTPAPSAKATPALSTPAATLSQ